MTNFFFIAISFPPFRSNMLFIYLYLYLRGNNVGFFHRRKFLRKRKMKYRMREISYKLNLSIFFFFSKIHIYIYIIRGSKTKSGRKERLSFSRQVSSKQVIEFFFFLTRYSWQEENGRETVACKNGSSKSSAVLWFFPSEISSSSIDPLPEFSTVRSRCSFEYLLFSKFTSAKIVASLYNFFK